MPKVLLANIEEGMVLAKDVKNNQGNLLLTADTVVSEKHIKIFKTWGVSYIETIGENEAEENFSSEELQQAKLKAESNFIHTDLTNPLIATLLEQQIKIIAKQDKSSGT